MVATVTEQKYTALWGQISLLLPKIDFILLNVPMRQRFGRA